VQQSTGIGFPVEMGCFVKGVGSGDGDIWRLNNDRLVNYFRNTIADDAVNRRKQTHEVEARFVVFELICENKHLEITYNIA